jgi:hypothetical protein
MGDGMPSEAMTRSSAGAIVASALLLVRCAGPRSVIDPAGPAAASIHHLGLVLWIGAKFVTGLVTVLMLVPFLHRRERSVNRRLFPLGGGVALPALTLLLTTTPEGAPPSGRALRDTSSPQPRPTVFGTDALAWSSTCTHRTRADQRSDSGAR